MATQSQNVLDGNAMDHMRATAAGIIANAAETAGEVVEYAAAPVARVFAPEWTCSGRHVAIFFAGLVTGIASILVESHFLH